MTAENKQKRQNNLNQNQLLEPELYTKLRKNPIRCNNINQNHNHKNEISEISFLHEKKIKESVFFLLFNEQQQQNNELINKRSVYLKEIVKSNKSYFPNELNWDKLMKKQVKSKKTQLESLLKNELLGNKRKKNEKNLKKDEEKKENNSHFVGFDNQFKEDNEYSNVKNKDLLYYEKYRRDSLDMLDIRINNIGNRASIDLAVGTNNNGISFKENNKVINDEESIQEEKSDEESFEEEYNNQDSEENYGSDDDGGDVAYSEY